MSGARRNPIGLPVPQGLKLVRVGSGEHTHIYNPKRGAHLCRSGIKFGVVPPLYETKANFVTCYRCAKLLAMDAAGEGYARANPVPPTHPVRVFSPSYAAESQDEYDRLAEEGPKSWDHRQVEGGRRALRFSEYGPYPRDPSPGYGARADRPRGPRREDGRIVGGDAAPVERSLRTEIRLVEKTPPWEARTQSPKVWVQTLDRMGYAVPEEFLAYARTNTKRLPASYKAAKTKKTRKRQRLEAEIRAAIHRYMAGSDVFVVPRQAQDLIDVGMPPRAAYELVGRTWPRRRRERSTVLEYEFLPSLASGIEAPELSITESITRHFGTTLRLSTDDALGLSDFALNREYGKLLSAAVHAGGTPIKTPIFLASTDIEDVDMPTAALLRQVLSNLDIRGAEATALMRPIGAPKLVLRFAKKTEEIELSSLQHSNVAQGSDFVAQVRYRTFDGFTLEDLPSALAGVMLRTKKEGRRLAPFVDTSLENPMSYWEKQYSKSPYGPSRSIPAARRNRGRPRTSKKTGSRTNEKKRTEDKWPLMRAGKKRLETMAKGRGKDSKEAKRELEYRKILRGDSTTKKARGKADKVTKGKNLSDWQAFQHENRGKGWSAAKMSREYRKAMAMKKKPSSSRKKPARKKSSRKSTAASHVVLRSTGKTPKGNKSDKFYILSLRGRTITAHYGSTTRGLESARTTKKTFKSAAAAQKAFDSTVRAKRKKGYRASRLKKLHAAPVAKKAAPKRKKTTTSPRRTSTRAKGRKVASKSPRTSKMRKGANRYRAFIKATMADGYSHAEARAIWHHEKGAYRNPRDLTHRREALVPSHQLDYWDNSVPTALMNPEYEDYDDFDYGPFSTGLAHTHGVQPVNRRNPRRSHHPIYEQTRGQFGVSEAWTHGVQPYGRRNPSHRHTASDPWHPVYEQIVGQFSTSEPWTDGLQPYSRRNPSLYSEYDDSWHPAYDQFIGQFGISEGWTDGIQPYSRRNPYDDDDLFDDDF